MTLLFVSATPYETAPLRQFLEEHFKKSEDHFFEKEGLKIRLMTSGVGMMQTAYALGKSLSKEPYHLVIQAGIGGAKKGSNLELGQVVQITSECYGDMGADQADGTFTDVHKMELIPGDQFPFTENRLHNPTGNQFGFLPKAKGITLNRVSGYPPSIKKLTERIDFDIESMEGVAFFYACLVEQMSFLSIRSVSNYIEARNKENWDIPLAINNLNMVLLQIIETLLDEVAAKPPRA